MNKNTQKSHCPQGHPYAGENLIIKKNGYRVCRTCKLQYFRENWRKKHPNPQKKGAPLVDNPKARRMVYKPMHPLAIRGYLLEARMVLYDTIGPGFHPCHWCQTMVQWLPGHGPRKGALVVDHIDWNPHNNATSNLVPSCQSCNGKRTRRQTTYTVHDEEKYIIRPNGTRLRAEQRTCAYCHANFLIAPASTTRGRGVFCSRSCARKAYHKTPSDQK